MSLGVSPIRTDASLTDRTVIAVREVMAGRRRGLRAILPFAGPAMIASVAYIDPGNFATNIQAGARYGYALLWVVLLANLVAMLFQSMSAKIGIVTNRNLAELCREHFPRPMVLAMWVVSEIAAMATDLAEFLGGAIGLSLLFHLPLLAGMVVTAIDHLRDPSAGSLRVSAVGAGDRIARRLDRALLFAGVGGGAAELGTGRGR